VTGQVLYTVTVSFQDPTIAEEWEDWMRRGHMQALLASGALRAELVRWSDPDEDGPAIHMTAHYVFPDQDTLDTYIRDHAPALREDGLQRFPTTRGIEYSRRIGAVHHPIIHE